MTTNWNKVDRMRLMVSMSLLEGYPEGDTQKGMTFFKGSNTRDSEQYSIRREYDHRGFTISKNVLINCFEEITIQEEKIDFKNMLAEAPTLNEWFEKQDKAATDQKNFMNGISLVLGIPEAKVINHHNDTRKNPPQTESEIGTKYPIASYFIESNSGEFALMSIRKSYYGIELNVVSSVELDIPFQHVSNGVWPDNSKEGEDYEDYYAEEYQCGYTLNERNGIVYYCTPTFSLEGIGSRGLYNGEQIKGIVPAKYTFSHYTKNCKHFSVRYSDVSQAILVMECVRENILPKGDIDGRHASFSTNTCS